jgi:hypothetical protein
MKLKAESALDAIAEAFALLHLITRGGDYVCAC